MTAVLPVLHAVALGILLLTACASAGDAAVRWIGLPRSLSFPVGFGCLSLAGLAAFCAWWIAPAVGTAVSLALLLGAVALAAAHAVDSESRREMRATAPVLLAIALLAAAWLLLVHAAGVPPSSRFTWALPVDDQLPRIFANRVAAGSLSGPIEGDWLMSDRPPLLTGVLLLFRPLGAGAGLPCDTIATLCQIFWLPALIALGHALSLSWRAIAAGVFFAATSGFFLLNTLYTWPKLMAATLFITAVAAVVEGMRNDGARVPRLAIAAGALLSLSALAHGGVWFSILALPAFPVAWTALRRFGVRGVATLLLAFAVVAAPWSAFKRFVDPPGNRLVKWHLAGAIDVDGRSSFEAIRDAYSKTPPSGLWNARAVNTQIVAGVFRRHDGESWDDYVRRLQFFHLGPAVGLPLLGVAWLLAGSLRAVRRKEAGLVAHALGTVLVWIALLFLPGGAIVHLGSYVPPAVLIFLGGAAIGRWHGAALAGVGALHAVVFLAGWILTTPPASDPRVSIPMMIIAGALVAAALAVPVIQARLESLRISVK